MVQKNRPRSALTGRLQKHQGAHNSHSCIHSAGKAQCHWSCGSLLVFYTIKEKHSSLCESIEREKHIVFTLHTSALCTRFSWKLSSESELNGTGCTGEKNKVRAKEGIKPATDSADAPSDTEILHLICPTLPWCRAREKSVYNGSLWVFVSWWSDGKSRRYDHCRRCC